MYRIIPISDVRAASTGHFFDPDTMRFFRSRLARVAYLTADGTEAFFVTSEQFVSSRGDASPRRWSVRRWNVADGDVSTAGTFQAHPDARSATRAARAFASREG